jgi:hypothetical protein
MAARRSLAIKGSVSSCRRARRARADERRKGEPDTGRAEESALFIVTQVETNASSGERVPERFVSGRPSESSIVIQ